MAASDKNKNCPKCGTHMYAKFSKKLQCCPKDKTTWVEDLGWFDRTDNMKFNYGYQDFYFKKKHKTMPKKMVYITDKETGENITKNIPLIDYFPLKKVVWPRPNKKIRLEKLEKNLDTLNDISKLADNWNSEGAKSFSKNLIQRTKDLLNGLTMQPNIYPNTNGSIRFEYEKDDGSYLEIQVTEDRSYNVYRKDNKGERNIAIDTKIGSMNRVVDDFFKEIVIVKRKNHELPS